MEETLKFEFVLLDQENCWASFINRSSDFHRTEIRKLITQASDFGSPLRKN